MKKIMWISLAGVGLLGGMYACSKVAVTNRAQLALIPNAQLSEMSAQEYQKVIQKGPLSTDAAKTMLVRNVGTRIKTAVEKYMADNGRSEEMKAYAWEFNLIQDDSMLNAWCMPGGKVAFYTGILPVCKNEAGIAVVMGHEVAHAIANHGNERMSQQIIAQYGASALDLATSQKSAQARGIFQQMYGVGAQVGVLLPFGRRQESEADKMGLVFMAIAGYDPNEAIAFWERMDAATGNGAPPEFLSTHPSNSTRIADLKAYLPEALKYYKPTDK
jgi:predicted Zn-dependent protease